MAGWCQSIFFGGFTHSMLPSLVCVYRVSSRTIMLLQEASRGVVGGQMFVELLLSVFTDWADVGPESCLLERVDKQLVGKASVMCLHKNYEALLPLLDQAQVQTVYMLYSAFREWEREVVGDEEEPGSEEVVEEVVLENAASCEEEIGRWLDGEEGSGL